MMEQLIIAGLVFLTVVGIGGALIAARRARYEPVGQRLRHIRDAQSHAWTPPRRGSRLGTVVQHLGRFFAFHRPTAQLQQQLARAGYFSPTAAPAYIGIKVLLLIIGLGAAFMLVWPMDITTPSKLFFIGVGGAVLSYIPNIVVRTQLKHRRTEIHHALPDAVDLLEICVSAGMGLDMAWNAVADDIRGVSPIFADEMALTNLETHLGASNAEAMRHMAERTGVQDLASLTAVLVQSERFGTSITEALRTFATSLREERSMRAQEAAEKMAVKLIIPMVLFIFPVAIVIMAGPAFIQLLDALR